VNRFACVVDERDVRGHSRHQVLVDVDVLKLTRDGIRARLEVFLGDRRGRRAR
jgi:hypothetical protein